MRKSTILIVSVIYFTSIIVIIFFGLQLSAINVPILVESVEFYQVEANGEILHEGEFDRLEDNTKTLIISTRDVEWNANGEFIVLLRWRFTPYYATETTMNITTLAPDGVQIINNQQSPAQIVFSNLNSARITISATDVPGTRDEILLVFVYV
ncbi:MAG: hypothetical protein FWE03_03755 [Firmicutes bacterium]|nr:hypothetical protein [Bacillota bacterium]